MISEEVLQYQAKMPQFSERERTALSVIVDIGTVTEVSADGNNVSIETFRTLEGMPITYNNVEVLYPAGVHMALGNALVLVVVPCSCVSDTQNGVQADGAYPYDGRGMKAIPIANNSVASTELLISNNKDSFELSNDAYSFNFLKNAISLITNNEIKVEVTQDAILVQWKNSLSFVVNDSGVSEVFYDGNGKTTKLVLHLFDGTETTYIGSAAKLTVQQLIDPSTYTNWKWIKIEKADGSVSYVQYNGSTELNKIEIDTSGNLNIVHNTNFKVEIGSSIKLTGSTGTLEVL